MITLKFSLILTLGQFTCILKIQVDVSLFRNISPRKWLIFAKSMEWPKNILGIDKYNICTSLTDGNCENTVQKSIFLDFRVNISFLMIKSSIWKKWCFHFFGAILNEYCYFFQNRWNGQKPLWESKNITFLHLQLIGIVKISHRNRYFSILIIKYRFLRKIHIFCKNNQTLSLFPCNFQWNLLIFAQIYKMIKTTFGNREI